jgi:hypothetical protein
MEEKRFLVKDISGRGYSTEYMLSELHELDKTYDTPKDDTITDWGDFAEVGDVYTEVNSLRITRIE